MIAIRIRTAIEYRDIKSKQNLTYLQTMEQLSRMAKSAFTTVKSTDRVLGALHAAAETGRLMPLFEIEEIAELVRSPVKRALPALSARMHGQPDVYEKEIQ
jgi:hypothetical protein